MRTLDTLQRVADKALYAAKHSWRNAWVGVEVQTMDETQVETFVQLFRTEPGTSVARGPGPGARCRRYVAHGAAQVDIDT